MTFKTIFGTSGADSIKGGAGDEYIYGLGGNDTLDGGGGSDHVRGGSGNDLLIYTLAENVGASDDYDGDSGSDTLRLQFTGAEWARADVQADIAAFLASRPGADFQFRAFKLKVDGIQKLEVYVNGVAIDPRDEAVTARPDSLTVSEDGPAGSVDLLANDSAPDRVASVVLIGAATLGAVTLTNALAGTPQSALLGFTPGADLQSLRAGETRTETLSYRVTDVDGDQSISTVTLTVTGANDAASIAGATSGVVSEDGTLSATGKLTVSDVDNGEAGAQARTNVSGLYGSFSIDAAGNWVYTLDNGNPAVQALASGATLGESFAVASIDGSATASVDIVINGANDVATIRGKTAGSVTEDNRLIERGVLVVSDVDAGEAAIRAASVQGLYGRFAINAAGNWIYTLDNGAAAVQALGAGATLGESFAVTSADGTGTAAVAITINGNNDAATIGGTTTGSVTEDNPLIARGVLTVSDVDTGEAGIQPTSVPGLYGRFAVNAAGNWIYTLDNGNAAVQALGAGATLGESFAVTSTDGTGTSTVAITIQGNNDAPVIAGQQNGAIREDVATPISGLLTIADPDAGQSSFAAQGNIRGAYGFFSVDTAGAWSYALDNSDPDVQALRSSQPVKDDFVVISSDGSASTTVSVTVTGVNDAATAITGAATGAVVEDGVQTAKGKLFVSDVDIGDDQVRLQTGAVGNFGTFSILRNGDWTYHLDNASAQSLGEGEQRTETFAVVSRDGTATTHVDVTVTGVNDAPVLQNDPYIFSVTENGRAGSVIGQVQAVDADASDTLYYRLTGGDAAAFTIDEATGVIRNVASLDFERKASYDLGVEVRDRANGGLTDTGTVQIQVNDVANEPSFAGGAVRFQHLVRENGVNTLVNGAFRLNGQDAGPVEVTGLVKDAGATVDFTDNEIVFDFSNLVGSYAPGGQNRVSIIERPDTLKDIVNVTIESSNVAGLDAADISFTAEGRIDLNLDGLSFTGASHFVLHVDFLV